jgi:cytochrome c oxidase subunit IV
MASAEHPHPPAGHGHDDAGPSFQMYLNIFYALCVFTALSFVFNTLARNEVITHMTSVGLIVLVAVIKAACVAAIFMHLKFDWGKVYCIMVPVSILAVMMMIVLLPDIVLGWHREAAAAAAHAPQPAKQMPAHQ